MQLIFGVTVVGVSTLGVKGGVDDSSSLSFSYLPVFRVLLNYIEYITFLLREEYEDEFNVEI